MVRVRGGGSGLRLGFEGRAVELELLEPGPDYGAADPVYPE
jgi:hypothetical protein